MSIRLQHMREAWSYLSTFVGKLGEIVVDTTNNRMIVHDGTTEGGWAAAKLSEVVTNTRAAVADTDYAVLATDRLVAYTAITEPRSVTLPAAASFPIGTCLMVVDESGSCSAIDKITLRCAGSDVLCGAATVAIASAYGYLAIESNGSNKWTILDQAASNLSAVGIGTAADPANPLSVYATSALLNSGSDIRVKINKAAASNTASFLFQDGFSGRAEIGLTGDDNFHFKVSANGSAWTTGIVIDATTGSVTLGNAFTAVADANYSALATDRLIACTSLSAARVITLPAASSFPAGTMLRVADMSGNCSTTNVLTINRTDSDTINGATATQLSTARGFLGLICDGAFKWIMCQRSANVVGFTSSGTYTPSPGLVFADVYVFGGGGGGGGGYLEATSTACSGGGGGGGGGANQGRFTAAEIGSSQAVTVGLAGASGLAATSSTTAGSGGGIGGATSFGSLLQASGGGGGAGGQLSATASGGGGAGGVYTSGAQGSSTGGGGGGGLGGSGGFGAQPAAATNNLAGGGGGGSSASGAAFGGSSAIYGGGGGGSGGGINASNVAQNGGAAGRFIGNGSGSLPSGGVAGGTVAGGAGIPTSTSGPLTIAGSGAGGGAGATAGSAGAGGAGGYPGGGGGGGGSAQNGLTAGTGGAGGAGFCVIVEHF
jgi:hypothetical protein